MSVLSYVKLEQIVTVIVGLLGWFVIDDLSQARDVKNVSTTVSGGIPD